MKILFSLLFLLTLNNKAFSQSRSQTADSLTKIQIESLNQKQRKQFDSILLKRQSADWLKRIDTSKADYIFIEEIYDSSSKNFESFEYYFRANDSIPFDMYRNNRASSPKGYYFSGFDWGSENYRSIHNLQPMLTRYRSFKACQAFWYTSDQIWEHGCVVYEDSREKFRTQRKKKLESSCCIRTMIDLRNNSIKVSVQYQPKKAKFKTISYNAIWDF